MSAPCSGLWRHTEDGHGGVFRVWGHKDLVWCHMSSADAAERDQQVADLISILEGEVRDEI